MVCVCIVVFDFMAIGWRMCFIVVDVLIIGLFVVAIACCSFRRYGLVVLLCLLGFCVLRCSVLFFFRAHFLG